MREMDFIKKLYNGKSCYSDPMTQEELEQLHIPSRTEDLLKKHLESKRLIFLTGNPGDGKTYIIKALDKEIKALNARVYPDINSEPDLSAVAIEIIRCYENRIPCIIAVNEYPFLKLLKEIQKISSLIYDELRELKRNHTLYSKNSAIELRQAVIVDLNNRSLVEPSYVLEIIKRLIELAKKDTEISDTIRKNLQALENDGVLKQLTKIFELVCICGEHFPMRDILGAISYMLTACDTNEYKGMPYYDAMFIGENDLIKFLGYFDPIYLSVPALDEQLWNGECKEGWRLDMPEAFPDQCTDAEEAIQLFKSLKRKYYFENVEAGRLIPLFPSELQECRELLLNIDTQREKMKKKIISSLNLLFLPTEQQKDRLRIWTTHSYDQSREISGAVSSRYVEASKLELCVPELPEWLKEMEYLPTHVILKPRDIPNPKLLIDITFFRALLAIEKGSPIGLLPARFEQATVEFLRALDNLCLAQEDEEGKIIIADRKKSIKKSIIINDSKYSLREV